MGMFDQISNRQRLVITLSVVAWLLVPVFVKQTYVLHVLILSMMFATFSAGWNLVTGFAGLKTFGHHAFFGLAAYSSALLSKNFGISPWITIWLAAGIAALFGFIVAVPVLRIRSIPHVAIVTLAFAEILRLTIANLTEITRGEMGLFGIPTFEGFYLPIIGDVIFNAAKKIPYFYIIALIFFGTIFAINRLMRSKTGLAIIAMRDSQDAAESLGVNLTFNKLFVFTVSAFVVGLSGAFYAHFIMVLSPSSVVGMDIMILVIAMVLVGGLGTHIGPIIGAFILTIGAELLREVGDYRLLFYGTFIIIIMRFLPNGIATLLQFTKTKRT